MLTVTTAIVSDLHLGATSGVDVARREEPLARLLETVASADRVVFLGDLLELRERPAAAVLEDVAPVLRRIGEAAAGRQVVVVPGNHDHQLVAPALERARLNGDHALPLQIEHEPRRGELAQLLADSMPRSEVVLAYPGIWLRDDVYATHGHYLDAHLTVPRVECLLAAAVRRYGAGLGADGPRAPDHYEAIVGPIYALANAIAQNARARPGTRRGSLSRRVWSAATARGDAGARIRGALIGRAAIPAAVAAINVAGFGPFTADLSATELRRAGLRAIGEVVDRLGIEADHVLFGHTHRAGPLDGELDEWLLPGGTRLTNTGSWIHEPVFVAGDGPSNPYWPGRVTLLTDTGPPELRNVLGDLELPSPPRPT
ncbi:MAG: metallophosphoesterase [Thermoleophilaceae bacterium]